MPVMPVRALTFGTVAEAYERFRPAYPTAIADRVLAYAGRPVRTALEIGAGTGKATRLFVRPGTTVTATDPDPAMLAELRRHLRVETMVAAFESLPTDRPYGLVYAAAALHWTTPAGRWPRVAALLEPGGTFASFGGPIRLVDPAVEEAVDRARAPFLATHEIPSPDGTPPGEEMQWPGTELLRSGLFTDVEQHVIGNRVTVDAAGYVGLLSTVSAYLELPPDRREQAYLRIAAALPDRVELAADTVLHLARRV